MASIKDVGLIDGFIGLTACLVIKSSRKRKLFSLISDFGKLMLGNVFFLTFLMNPKSTLDLEILIRKNFDTVTKINTGMHLTWRKSYPKILC